MTKLFGIIGNPIKHSLYPLLHNYWFDKYKIDANYSLIEASEKSFWYGFTDDMIIRIEKLITNDIIINVRSASRIGKSDFGKNSKRIKSYFVLMQ